MGFLSPWFLAGAAAVGLPIWLHLLRRHRQDPRPFPSLMFFEPRTQSSVKHRRLEYILLFLLRALMLVLLALLFANPFFNRALPPLDTKKLTVIAVDHSFSMRAADHLAQAKQEAASVLSGVKPGATAQVIALGSRVQALTQQVSDPGELHAAIDSIQPSDGRASFGELARYLRTLSESSHTALEVHLISDLQKTAMPPGYNDLRLDPGTDLIFHPIGGAAPNWTVENVVSPRRVYDPKKVHIQVTVAGFATQPARRTVSLVLNGRVLQTKDIDVGASSRAQTEFLGLDTPYGFSKGEVRIDASDAFPADDRFPFAVERTDPKKVLFIDDGRHPRAEVYFAAALDSSADAEFQLESMRPEQALHGDFSKYAFLVISDLGSLPSGFDAAVQHYVTSGGSVLVALGAASATLPQVPVTGEPVDSVRYASPDKERFLSVTEIDEGHPALRHLDRFTGVKFCQAIHVTPKKSVVLARLDDQTPLVLEQTIGEGKVLVFTSPFDNTSNDLPIHAAWVPFIEQTAAYLGGGADQPVNLPVDSYVELRSGKTGQGMAAEVLDPDGQRVLSLQEATTAANFQVTREGFYEMKGANGRPALVAVHADRRESDLTVIPRETLDLWKATGASDTQPSDTSTSSNGEQKRPWPLAPILLLILLGIAIAESVVADRYLRAPPESEPGRKREAA